MLDLMRFNFLSPPSGNTERAGKLMAVARVLSDFLGKDHAIVSLGDPVFSYDLTETGIITYLAHVQSQMANGVAEAVCFSDKRRDVNFFFASNNIDVPYEYIWF